MIERFIPILLMIYAPVQLASVYFPSSLLDLAVSAMSGLIVALLVWRMHGAIRWTSAILLVLGTVMLAANGATAEGFAQALRFHAGIATLFIVTPLLSLPIYQGKFEQAMKEVLLKYGRKATGYSFFAMLLNCLTAFILNMGALILVHSLTKRSGEPWRTIQGKAMMRGYGSTVAVSPYFVSMGIIMLYFQCSWFELVRVTGPVVLAWFLLHYLDMRLKFGNRDLLAEEGTSADRDPKPVSRESKIKLLQLGVAALVFTGILLAMESNTAHSMVTLVCTASLIAPVAGFMLLRQTRALLPVLNQSYLRGRLPMVSKEVALMLSVGYFSYPFQESGAAGRLLSLLPADHQAGWLVLAVMVAVFYVLTVLGFHPLVVVSMILSIVVQDDFGLPPGVIPAVILCAWGLALMISPFSGSAFLLSGLLGTSSFTISLLWNWKFVIAGTLAMFGVVYLVA